jgi:hypothetical protein
MNLSSFKFIVSGFCFVTVMECGLTQWTEMQFNKNTHGINQTVTVLSIMTTELSAVREPELLAKTGRPGKIFWNKWCLLRSLMSARTVGPLENWKVAW